MQLRGPLARLRQVGLAASRALAGLDIDFVVCEGTSAIPFIETEHSIAFWHDSTWRGYHSQFGIDMESFRAVHPELHEWDRRVFERVDCAVFSSQWAAEMAQSTYDIEAARVHVIPYGANMVVPSTEDVARSLNERSRDECRLLFVGIDWERKGLDHAVAVTRRLRERGVPVTLSVVGPRAGRLDDLIGGLEAGLVNHLGFLDKAVASDVERLAATLGESHFLVHPASFECFGIALVEANAFGVPVVATPVTGIPTIVRTGENGRLFELSTFVDMAADFIENTFRRFDDRYLPLSVSARRAYERRFQWVRNGGVFRECLRASR